MQGLIILIDKEEVASKIGHYFVWPKKPFLRWHSNPVASFEMCLGTLFYSAKFVAALQLDWFGFNLFITYE